MLNIAVTAFFNVAKPGTSTRSSGAFVALVVSDAVAFGASMLSAFCSTFAGLSIMDRRTRLAYRRVAGLSLVMASLAVVAVFVLATYLAFATVYPRLSTPLCALALAAIAPQVAPIFLVLLHMRTLLHRLGLQRLCTNVAYFILGLITLALIPAVIAAFVFLIVEKITRFHHT